MLLMFNINQSDKWDEIIRSFSNYDVYYLSSYIKAFQIHGDGEPILFYYEGQNIKAINVVMKRDVAKDPRFDGKIAENTYFDITTPYGYGGFIIEGETTRDSLTLLDNEYTSICKEQGIISEIVRFHPVINNINDVMEVYELSILGQTITMKLDSPEQIWNDLTSKNRNVIRKAIKSGVKIYWGRNEELFDKFVKLYNATMDHDNAREYYYFKEDFYCSVLNDLRYNSLIFYAEFEGRIISASIILFSNGHQHYHLSASDREYQSLAATNLLLYEAACWGCENGHKTFHLGGGLGCRTDNLYNFKKAFNRSSDTTFGIGRKIFDQLKFDELLSIRAVDESFDLNTCFFPAYRG